MNKGCSFYLQILSTLQYYGICIARGCIQQNFHLAWGRCVNGGVHSPFSYVHTSYYVQLPPKPYLDFCSNITVLTPSVLSIYK